MEHRPADPVSQSGLIEALSHTRLSDCYQCGKCTAGCPVSLRMDVPPNQLIRLLQLGQAEKAQTAASVWLCVSCQTCSARCPKSVDCAAVMDALRQRSLECDETHPTQHGTVIFQKAFLDNIRRYGRLNELELIAIFKSNSFRVSGRFAMLFKDATLAPRLAKRQKLHLTGEKVRDRKVLDRIFSRCLNS